MEQILLNLGFNNHVVSQSIPEKTSEMLKEQGFTVFHFSIDS